MICKYCGNEIEAGAKFCTSCGKPAEAAPPPQNTYIPPAEPVNARSKQRGKGTATWKIITMLLVFMTIVSMLMSSIMVRYDVSLFGISQSKSDVSLSFEIGLIPAAASVSGAVVNPEQTESLVKDITAATYGSTSAGIDNSVIEGIQIISVLLFAYMCAVTLSALLLLIALIMILKNRKAGAIIGFIGCIIAFLTAAAVSVIIFILGAQIMREQNALNEIQVTILPSLWLFMAIPFSAAAGITMLAMKNKAAEQPA